ncbi:MAG: 2-C-methyl-D-erythritol 4-phosphate cytidylyltransferase [Bacillus sp. (in: firmicutes)]
MDGLYYEVIVLAAGQGKRMNAGKNKVFLDLGGMPLICRTLKVFDSDPFCRKIILPINPVDRSAFEALLGEYPMTKEVVLTEGGQERQNSVHNGLKKVHEAETDIVLVHDGARPFVRQELITELVNLAFVRGGAIPAVQVKDTIKQVQDGQVINTMERSSLWAVHTPQAFRVPLLKRAHQYAADSGLLGTDDASLLEAIGEPVMIVEDDYNNIKITTPEDLYFAEAIRRTFREEGNQR